MRILIYGGSGFVGSNIAYSALQKGWEIFIAATGKIETLSSVPQELVNIIDFASVNIHIEKVKPDVVVNTAAIADIDFAEREKEIVYDTNVIGAVNIAKACEARKIKYIFFSSDAVFEGNANKYSENDELKPLNYYGFTKAEAEKQILEITPQSIIIRISLVLGFPLGKGNSFVAGLEKRLKANNTIFAATDIIRTPIDVHTLADVILELCQIDLQGILHIGCIEKVNRFELTKMLAKSLGFPTDKIINQEPSGKSSLKVPRHKNGILDVSKADKVLKTKMLSLDETIRNAVKKVINQK